MSLEQRTDLPEDVAPAALDDAAAAADAARKAAK